MKNSILHSFLIIISLIIHINQCIFSENNNRNESLKESINIGSDVIINLARCELTFPISIMNHENNIFLEFIISGNKDKAHECIFYTQSKGSTIAHGLHILGYNCIPNLVKKYELDNFRGIHKHNPPSTKETIKYLDALDTKPSQLKIYVQFEDDIERPLTDFIKWNNGNKVNHNFILYGSVWDSRPELNNNFLAVDITKNIMGAFKSFDMLLSPGFEVGNFYQNSDNKPSLISDSSYLPKTKNIKGKIIIRKFN